jgi:hypothetical protein
MRHEPDGQFSASGTANKMRPGQQLRPLRLRDPVVAIDVVELPHTNVYAPNHGVFLLKANRHRQKPSNNRGIGGGMQ